MPPKCGNQPKVIALETLETHMMDLLAQQSAVFQRQHDEVMEVLRAQMANTTTATRLAQQGCQVSPPPFINQSESDDEVTADNPWMSLAEHRLPATKWDSYPSEEDEVDEDHVIVSQHLLRTDHIDFLGAPIYDSYPTEEDEEDEVEKVVASELLNVPLPEVIHGYEIEEVEHIDFLGVDRLMRSGSISKFLRSGSFKDPADEEHEHGSGKTSGPLLSGAADCISSCGMILLNKVVLSTYNFNAGITLMLYQNLICCLAVAGLSLCRVVSVEKLNWKLIRIWIPVNHIFIGMVVSSMYSLKHMNIAMVTILKNVTNILTAIGELYIFRKHQSKKVWIAMFFMIISAIIGGVTDLSFDAFGYSWQFANCILTASYSLTLRRVMDKAKQATKSGSLNEISMVLLNNLLSLPFGAVLIILFDELEYVMNADVIREPMFWIAATTSGLLGLALSFTSVWFLHQTGPTTYSLIGSLNKIPLSLAGLVLFNVPLNLPNLFSILFGLFAAVLFAKAKMS